MNELVLQNTDKNMITVVDKIKANLPAIQEQTKIFNRNNSQTTLAMTTMTMMTGQSPMRMMRQALAEIEKRTSALYEAQHWIAEKEAEIEELELKKDKTKVDEAKIIMLKHQLTMTRNKADWAMKDIAALMDSYEAIKKTNNIDEWDEKTFEIEEKKHHIRRWFELAYRDLVSIWRIEKSILEYLQQYWVHWQVAEAEIRWYIASVTAMIKDKNIPTAQNLEMFLDEMRDKYYTCADEVTEVIYWKKDILNTEYMLLTNKK